MSMDSINDKASFSSQNQTIPNVTSISNISENLKSQKIKKIKTDGLSEDRALMSPITKEQSFKKSMVNNKNNDLL